MRVVFFLFLWFAIILPGASCKNTGVSDYENQKGIAIYAENPFYWSYDGSPVLLIGGTVEDNIFQINDLEAHLDQLKSAGGNYIRCTLSSRDEGNSKPFLKNDQGQFDLNKPNPDYWDKLKQLLEISKRKDIIVQIEIWATYDFYWGELNWADNPFNPGRNTNYSSVESQLPDSVNYPAQSKVNPFFESVPELSNNRLLLDFQKQFVDRVLETTLTFDHVLYCIDNETNAHYAWGKYWAQYIRQKAISEGKAIFVTEMWDNWDPTNGAIPGAKLQHPDLGGWYEEYTNPDLHEFSNYAYSIGDKTSYNYVDIANHNAQDGQTHYDTGLWVRNTIEKSGNPRPINNVKIYGADTTQIWSGSREEAQQRFWRNIFAGHASVRFHRPPAGIGLSEMAQVNIRSMRKLTENVDFFTFFPSNQLLTDREDNEAYCLSNGKDTFLVYFPSAGNIHLNIPQALYSARQLNIANSTWSEAHEMTFTAQLSSNLEEASVFVVVLKSTENQ